MEIVNKWLLFSVVCLFFCCESPEVQQAHSKSTFKQKSKTTRKVSTNRTRKVTTPVQHKDYQPVYSWKRKTANQSSVYHIPAPEGYQRTSLQAKPQFAYWLRHLPLQPAGSKVYLYDGNIKPYQEGAHSVIDIDIGKRDLQQCADAVMRLKAEYHYSQKDYKNIHFNYTSGHTVSFDDWRKGKQPNVSGSSVGFSAMNGKTDNSYKNFKRYMKAIFTYAGTASLSKELKRVSISDMQIGDVFIKGGFPGHAVIVVDMAVNSDTGKKAFLIAQSYMPAQSIHVLINPDDNSLSPWYSLDFEGELRTPEWRFSHSDLKRFK